MTCERYAEKIPEYIRGNLSDTEAKGFRAHVATCPACQEELKDLNWFDAGAKANGQRMAEDHIAPRLLYEFVEGSVDLGPNTAANIKTHLGTCDTCRQDRDWIATVFATESPVKSERGRQRPRLVEWIRYRPLRSAFAGLILALLLVASILLIQETARGPAYHVSIISPDMGHELIDLPLSDLVRGDAHAPISVPLGDLASNPIALRLEIDLFEDGELPSTVTIENDDGEVVREIRVPPTQAETGTILLLLDKTSFAPGRHTVEVLDGFGGSMGWADIDVR